MRTDADLSVAIESWLESQARRPEHVPAADWLLFEQEKHERLLSAAGAVPPPLKEAG